MPHRVGPTTERLFHRAMQPEDAEAFFVLNSNPEVLRHTGEPPLHSVAEARERIEAYEDFDTIGYGRWGSFLAETGAMIGFCGLKYLPEMDEVDIGYRFLPEYWGRGLATEAGTATPRLRLRGAGPRRDHRPRPPGQRRLDTRPGEAGLRSGGPHPILRSRLPPLRSACDALLKSWYDPDFNLRCAAPQGEG